MLRDALARELTPAPAKGAAVCFDRLLAFVDRYGLMREGAGGKVRNEGELEEAMSGLARDYRDGLRHLPIALLDRAVTATIQTYRNGFRPPMPAEVAATVESGFLRLADLRSRTALAISTVSRRAAAS